MEFLDFLLFASLYNNSKFRREAAYEAAQLNQDDYTWGEVDDDEDEYAQYDEYEELDGLF